MPLGKKKRKNMRGKRKKRKIIRVLQKDILRLGACQENIKEVGSANGNGERKLRQIEGGL